MNQQKIILANPQEEFAKIRDRYKEDRSQDTFNLLLKGDKGIGKTLLCLTANLPIFYHSFDPGGTKHLRPEIDAGKVLVDSQFEKEDARNPTAYMAWEHEFDRLVKNGFFNNVGTYVLDGLTFWLEAGYNEIATRRSIRGTPFANDGQLEIKGWGVLLSMMKGMIKMCTSLPCDFILCAHATKTKEEVSGSMITGLSVPPSLQIPVPALFDEYYYLIIDPKGTKDKKTGQVERVIQTGTTDRVIAGTRIGRDKFDLYEETNIKKLLKKAGKSTEDKPLFL